MKVGVCSGAMGRAVAHGTAVLAGLTILALAMAGCSTAHSRAGATALPSELKIGITPNYPPLALKADGQLKGVEVDLAQMLGKQLGVKTTLVEMRWDDLIPALLDGRIDVIMSGMSITAGRLEYVDFTVPYMTVGQMALVRKIELPRRREQGAIDQPDARVGVIQNTTGDYWARRTLKKSTVMGFTSVEEGVEALRGNKVDFFVSDAPTIWQITSRRSDNADLAGIYRSLTTEYLAWAVRQGDDSLRHQLNTTLLAWEQNGQLAEILDDWISTRRVTLQLK